MCDCMRTDEACFHKLEKLLKAINESYAAIGLDVEALLCGLHINESALEQRFDNARHDLFAKIHKFKAFQKIRVAFQFIPYCKDDVQAMCYAVRALKERWKVDKPEHAIICRYDEDIDKKTWAWGEFREGKLCTLDQFLNEFSLCHETLRQFIDIKAKSDVQLLSFITHKLSVNPFGDSLLTFSDNEDACPDILVNETDACWCKHILRTHPKWIVKDLKTWGWIDGRLLRNANEIHATELIDLIRRSPVLLIKHDGRFLDAFYSCMENKLHPALSYGKFIDSCTVLDFNEALRRTCTNRNAVNAEMFIQHFFTKDTPNEKDSSNHN